ncbi:MAG: hypothetical protein ABUJ98_15665, partial [Hyphomicrobium sp.]
MPQTQIQNMIASGAHRNTAAMQALDDIVRNIQDLQEQVDRCVKYPVTEDTTVSAELPDNSDRVAGPYVGMDANGEPVALAAPTDTSITTAFSETLLDDTNAQTARATLEILQGTVAARPAAGTSGRTYHATDTGQVFYDTGSAWLDAGFVVDTLANRPAAGTAGRRFLATDSGQLFYDTGAAWTELGYSELPPDHLSGCELTWTDANTITIAAGKARNSADDDNIVLAASLAKDIDATWAAGAGGGLNATDFASGTNDCEASTWYHVFLIEDGAGTVDAGFDKSIAATNLKSDSTYTKFRYIGSVKTDGSKDILAFIQHGDTFLWDASVQDIYAANFSNAIQTHTLASVPDDVRVEALVTMLIHHTGQTSFFIHGHGDISTLPTPDADHHTM